ncbi:MAG: dihydroxyacetone kinase subunit DhaK [Verrucomicrobia bacterium]|nr:dihydroxyacetone kinase subunit DhaK [Verrucomicrobiota bacterium]
MRYFIRDQEKAAADALAGILSLTDAPVRRVGTHTAVFYPDSRRRQVKIVVGGGSGHEPLFLGIVGPGLADGGVAGQVFAAPTPEAILATIEAVQAPDGVVLIYGNYSGDVLNFGVALDDAKAKGIPVGEIRVHDDVASSASSALEDRRGTAGDIFVIKAASAAADAGLPFQDVVRLGEKMNFHTRSLGVASRAATAMETGEPMFELPEGEIEIGMGLHGEMGVRRSGYEPAETLVPRMMEMLAADFRETNLALDRSAVMINGLGGTTVLELLVIAGHVRKFLDQHSIAVVHQTVGQFATSLDMEGFSISISQLDDELEPLLSAKCQSLSYTRP